MPIVGSGVEIAVLSSPRNSFIGQMLGSRKDCVLSFEPMKGARLECEANVRSCLAGLDACPGRKANIRILDNVSIDRRPSDTEGKKKQYGFASLFAALLNGYSVVLARLSILTTNLLGSL